MTYAELKTIEFLSFLIIFMLVGQLLIPSLFMLIGSANAAHATQRCDINTQPQITEVYNKNTPGDNS